MEKLPLVEMREIVDAIVMTDNYQNVLSIVDVDATSSEKEFTQHYYADPFRLNVLFMVLGLQGSTRISLDFVSYDLKENTFLIIMPTHIVQMAETSNDFKCKLIIVDHTFIEECNTAKRSPSMSNYLLLRKNPLVEVLPEETEYISKCIEVLRNKIRMRTHSFHRELLQNGFVGFLLELANILVGKNDAMVRTTLSRKEEILNNFLQLLFTHVREEHNVSFYAGKLFITPQYLSLILKELTGKSANKWIDDALLVEAKVLLKMPNYTVQQVADQLNFSDQSTFGKFFKKQMGVSPMGYRKA